MANRAIFIDRDGVINKILYFEDMGRIDTPFNVDQFELLPNVGEAVRRINEMGFNPRRRSGSTTADFACGPARRGEKGDRGHSQEARKSTTCSPLVRVRLDRSGQRAFPDLVAVAKHGPRPLHT